MGTYGQTVGEWLGAAMAATGFTNKDTLAEKAKVNRSVIYEILGGKGHPAASTVADLAKAMKVQGPDFALTDTPKPADAAGWVRQARLALETAERLLKKPPTAAKPGARELRVVRLDAKRKRPPPPPDQQQGGTG